MGESIEQLPRRPRNAGLAVAEKGAPKVEDKGLSARHLILVFLAGVAVCAVFFSLGFLVGYHERPSRAAPVAERVTPPPVIPPIVNPPLATGGPAGKEPAKAGTSAESAGPPPSRLPEQVSSQPAAQTKSSEVIASPSAAPPSAQVTVPRGTSPADTLPGAPVGGPSGPGGEVGTGFTVQVTASRNKQDAERLVGILKSSGYPVFLVTPEYAFADDNLFRVQVGPFATREDAEKVRAKLAKEGFKDLFIRR